MDLAGCKDKACLQRCIDLSQTDADLEVAVVGEEDRPPYNRTTVNKGLLSGAVDATALPCPAWT